MWMRVKASLTLGREYKPWVKGLIGAQQCSWEILPCELVLVCSWSMGSIESICLLDFGRNKGVCKEEDLLKALKMHVENLQLLYMLWGYGILLFREPTFTPCFMIPMVNHCASLGRENVMCLVLCWRYCKFFVCIYLNLVFPSSVGGLHEA